MIWDQDAHSSGVYFRWRKMWQPVYRYYYPLDNCAHVSILDRHGLERALVIPNGTKIYDFRIEQEK